VAGEERAGENGVHKTSTTEVDFGCLPGNEEVTAGLQISLSPAIRWVWKKAVLFAAADDELPAHNPLYGAYFQWFANQMAVLHDFLGPSLRKALTRFVRKEAHSDTNAPHPALFKPLTPVA
jgi:hypothetical protein